MIEDLVAGPSLLGVAVVALTLVLTPGPNMIYLVSRAITQGRRAGLISLAGVGAGFVLYLVLSTAGLTAVFVAVPFAYTMLKLLGAAYLLFLAWQAIRPRRRTFDPSPTAGSPIDGPWKLFAMGLVTNLLNPKIAVLYLSILPQFIDAGRGSVALQSLILGGTQVMIALAVNAVIVVFAGTIGGILTSRPRWLRFQRYTTGAVLAGLATWLLVDRSRPAAG